MNIPVMLTDGSENFVSKDELQFLLSANRVLCFERADGCVFIGYDKMRGLRTRHIEDDRRNNKSLIAP